MKNPEVHTEFTENTEKENNFRRTRDWKSFFIPFSPGIIFFYFSVLSVNSV